MLFLYFFFKNDAVGESYKKVFFMVVTDNTLDEEGVSLVQVILSDDGHGLVSVDTDE